MMGVTQAVAILLVFLLSSCGMAVHADNYVWHAYNGHMYALTLDWQSWLANEAEAVSAGGHLVTINDEAENLWLATTFANTYNRNGYGDPLAAGADIGYYLNPITSQWEWISGEPVTYARLCVYFPQGGTKAYLHVIPQMYNDLAWNANPWHTEPAPIGNPDYYFKGIIEVAPVPEPSSLLALVGGMGGMAVMLRRR